MKATIYFGSDDGTWTGELPVLPRVGDLVMLSESSGHSASGDWVIDEVVFHLKTEPDKFAEIELWTHERGVE